MPNEGGKATDPVIAKLLAGKSAADLKADLSGYASSHFVKKNGSHVEVISEAWAEFLNNPTPRPLAKAIGERIESLAADRMKKP